VSRLIALTGNIAAGKSTVAQRWAARGAAVVDADQLARDAVAPGTPALAAIARQFGAEILLADGSLDRAALRRRVFADAAARTALNAIVHPEVTRRRDVAVHAARASGAPLIVCDIPLLFETGTDRQFETIVLVDAPEAVRLDRLVRDRGLSPTEAQAMIDAQHPSADKRTRAHYILDNDGTRESLIAAADACYDALTATAG
jgi:dephospho-CoA kinase